MLPNTENPEPEHEFDAKCSVCNKGFNWEDIDGKQEPFDIEKMIWILRRFGAPKVFRKVSRAYSFDCECGNHLIMAEILEACEPDENGFKDSAYVLASISFDDVT